MKVLLAAPSPALDAAGRMVRGLASGLSARSVEVCVLVPGAGPLGEGLRAAGVAVERIRFRRAISLVPSLRIARLIQRLRPDAVHAFGFVPAALAGTAASRAGVGRVLLTELEAGGPRGLLQGLKGRYEREVRLRLARDGAFFLALSERARAALVEGGVPCERTALVHPGVPVAPADRGGSREKVRTRLALENGVPTAWSPFPADPARRAALVEAFAIVRREFPGAALLVPQAGGDLLRRAARLKIQGGVRPVEGDGGEGEGDAAAAADVAIFAEPAGAGQPLGWLEAAAAGLPSVAVRGGGAEEFIQDQKTGILAAEDPPSIAAAAAALLRDPARARELGRLARERVARRNDPARAIAEHERLYG